MGVDETVSGWRGREESGRLSGIWPERLEERVAID